MHPVLREEGYHNETTTWVCVSHDAVLLPRNRHTRTPSRGLQPPTLKEVEEENEDHIEKEEHIEEHIEQ